MAEQPIQPDPPADSPERPSGSILSVLVRLRPAGTVVWVGTIHQLKRAGDDRTVQRGDEVVIRNLHGCWLATVLRVGASASVPTPTLAGELLRFAERADHEAESRAAEKANRLLAQTRSDRAVEQLTIVAAEVSLDQQAGLLRMLGKADAGLGPSAVRLASACELPRVQWIAVEAGDGAATAATTIECTPDEAAEADFWQRMQQVITEGGPLGAKHRVAAGNRGLYQQKFRRLAGPSPAGDPVASPAAVRRWMIRMRTAAGGITFHQLRQLAELAMEFGDGSLRLTSRQAVQLHGIELASAPQVIDGLRAAMLHTAGSCGNTVRNFTCCPLPPQRARERQLRSLAARLATDFLPTGPAFECWPEGADPPLPLAPPPPDASSPEAHRQVLPHKWKVGLAVAGHNCVDVLNNDLAIVLRGTEGDRRTEPRVDIFVGGSTAYQPDRDGSVAQLAEWLGTVPSGDVNALLDSLLQLYLHRVLGERRPWRRWKYVVRRLGIATIRDALAHTPGGARLRFTEGPPAEAELRAVDHPLEKIEADGRRTFCVPLPAGRLPCQPSTVAALRRLAALRATARLAPQHRLVIADVRAADRREVLEALAVIAPEAGRWCAGHDPAAGSGASRQVAAVALPVAIACPAFPSCPLAVDEAERVLPAWQRVVSEVASGLAVSPPRFALSGCGNGCSRPLTSEIGVVAERRGARRVFFGGGGTRLGVSVGQVEDAVAFRRFLEPWLARYAASRQPGEPFGEWFWRTRTRGKTPH